MDDPVTFEVCEDAEGSEGATVTWLEDEIPEVELPDGTVQPALSQDDLSADAVETDGSRAEEVCQPEEDELEEGDVVAPVARGPIAQGPKANGPQAHGPISTEGGDYVSGYTLPGYSLSGMSVPGVSISGDSLEGYVLEGAEGTERSGEDEVYYTTEGDVLFDSDEYELRADAAAELQAIADDIAERDDDYRIEVEGHTDDLPTDAYEDNYELSELRAEEVAGWLVDNAGVEEDAIDAAGLGEDYPRADNDTDEGRQQNRRVVITVIPEGSEDSEIDHELEEDS